MIVDANKTDMPPCEDCLILGACKNKRDVRCSLLYDWWTRGTARERAMILKGCLPYWGRIIKRSGSWKGIIARYWQ